MFYEKKLITFIKHSTLDVWHVSEYTSGFLKLFCHGSLRDTPDFEFSPYSEIIHGSTTFTLLLLLLLLLS